MSFADTVAAIREQDGIVYIRTRSTACMRSPTRRRCTGISPTSTSSRSTTRGSCSRPSTTRRCASRASTTWRWARARTRTSCRASARAVCACARSAIRRSSCCRCAPPKSSAGQAARLSAVPQVGCAGEGPGPLGEGCRYRRTPCCVATDVTTDEIYERYLRKAIDRDQPPLARDRAGGRRRTDRTPDRASAREHLPAQVRAAGPGAPGGRRVPRARRHRADRVAAAAARRPDGGVRNELREVRGKRPGRRRRVAAPRASDRRAEARRRDGRRRARVPERRRLPTLVASPARAWASCRSSRPRSRGWSSPTSTSRSTRGRRRPCSGTPSRQSGRGGQNFRLD